MIAVDVVNIDSRKTTRKTTLDILLVSMVSMVNSAV
jgi:hypothetical protein